jgi:hypothetical protein
MAVDFVEEAGFKAVEAESPRAALRRDFAVTSHQVRCAPPSRQPLFSQKRVR